MGKGAVDRSIPGGGTEKIGVLTFDDIIESINAIRGEQFSVYGHPARFVKIASQSSAAAGSEFPDDGSGVAQAGAAGTITLAAGAPSFDLTGLLVLLISGTGSGQVRRVSAYNTGTKVANVSPNWSVTPDNTTNYRLLIDVFRMSELHVKTEFQNVAATDPNMSIIPVLYDYAETSGGLFLRTPVRFLDYELSIENLGVTTDPVESGYKLGRTRTTPSRGALGAKIRIATKPTSGAYSLWACGT